MSPPSTSLMPKFKGPLLFFGASFLFHLIWENLHAPLYVGFEVFGQHFLRCFYATVTGDMIFMLIIYLMLAVVFRDFWWVNDRKNYAHPRLWILAVVMGIFISVSFEWWAVYVNHRWVYTAMMPIIPLLNVGLTPVLQMILVPLCVLFVSRIFSK